MWFLREPRISLNEKSQFCEILRPTLTFSRRLPFQSLEKVVKASRENFLFAQKHYGGINLIHAHVSYPAGYIAYRLSREFNVPYVVTEHMGPFPGSFIKNGNLLPEIEKAFKYASKIIAVSNFLKKRLISFGFSNVVLA